MRPARSPPATREERIRTGRTSLTRLTAQLAWVWGTILAQRQHGAVGSHLGSDLSGEGGNGPFFTSGNDGAEACSLAAGAFDGLGVESQATGDPCFPQG